MSTKLLRCHARPIHALRYGLKLPSTGQVVLAITLRTWLAAHPTTAATCPRDLLTDLSCLCPSTSDDLYPDGRQFLDPVRKTTWALVSTWALGSTASFAGRHSDSCEALAAPCCSAG